MAQTENPFFEQQSGSLKQSAESKMLSNDSNEVSIKLFSCKAILIF